MHSRLSKKPLVLSSLLATVAVAAGLSLTFATQSQAISGGKGVVRPKPWAVQVVGKTETCSGSLIGAKWVLTAAHCAEGKQAKDITVRVGSTHVGQGIQGAVDTTYVHPDYSSDQSGPSSRHDLALLHLFTPTGQQTLPLGGKVSVGEHLTIYGYGRQTNDTLSRNLKSASDKVLGIGPGVFTTKNVIHKSPSESVILKSCDDSDNVW